MIIIGTRVCTCVNVYMSIIRYASIDDWVQRIHMQIYTCTRVRDMSLSSNEDIACTRIRRYSKTYTRAHAFAHMLGEHMHRYMF